MDSYFYNLQPILEPVFMTLIILGLLTLVGIVLFLAHNYLGLNLITKHDNNLVGQFLEKYPLVNPDFYKKTRYEQIVENNQEIHEKDKKDEEQDLRMEHLEQYTHEELKGIKNTIADIAKVLEEMKENGQIR